MAKLVPMEFNNQRLITTRLLAEEYGTDENNIQMNFLNNQCRFKEGKHFIKLEGQELKIFKNSLPNEIGEPLKFAPKLILWTEKGAARHAKILETDEAWEVYEQLEETYFRVRDNKYLGLSKELQAIFALDTKTQIIENRLDKIENTMTIDYSQQLELSSLARVVAIRNLGGKDSLAYKELNKKVFSQVWRDYQNKFNVNSYRNTSAKDYEKAREYIISWKPNRELELMILGANIQKIV